MPVDAADMRGVERGGGEGTLRREWSAARAALGRKLARITGRRHFWPGFVGAYELAPLSRIITRQHGLNRYVDHARVAEIGLAIREGELHGFGDTVQIGSGVVAELVQLSGIEEIYRLQQRGSLAPRAAGMELDVAERGLDRLVEAGMIICEILGR